MRQLVTLSEQPSSREREIESMSRVRIQPQ